MCVGLVFELVWCVDVRCLCYYLYYYIITHIHILLYYYTPFPSSSILFLPYLLSSSHPHLFSPLNSNIQFYSSVFPTLLYFLSFSYSVPHPILLPILSLLIHSIRAGVYLFGDVLEGWWFECFKVWPRMFYRSGWLRCVLCLEHIVFDGLSIWKVIGILLMFRVMC